MKSRFLAGLLAAGIAAWAAAVSPHPAAAHCVGVIPKVKLTFPAEGVAIHEANYVELNAVFVDTFYRESLRAELQSLLASHQYAVFAYVDSIRYFLVLDSFYFDGKLDYVDTLRGEGLWMTIHSQLKGPAMPRQLYVEDSQLIYIPERPLATSYTGYLDTPFVAFFNSYENVAAMKFGPVDGCYFEPKTFMIIDGGIVKKGDEGTRMPGVSLAAAEFLKAAGREGGEVPGIRPRHTAIRRGRQVMTTRRVAGVFDAMGRLRKPVHAIEKGEKLYGK